MEAQVDNLKKLLPEVLVKYPIDDEEKEDMANAISSVFVRETARAAHGECVSLQKTLNQTVAPEVVVGTVTTGALNVAILSLARSTFALPMSYADAAALYEALDPSLVGVELRGDVLDTDLRRSHEILATQVTLPSCLSDFDFPEDVKRIHDVLCPSAESIRVEAYKLIVYGKGDFFVPHRDSMDQEDMFGTLSLGLPISSPSGGGDTVEESEGMERRVPVDCRSEEGRLGEPGQLVLYVGQRESDVSVASQFMEEEVIENSMLTYVVDMESIVVGGSPNSDGAAGTEAGLSVTMRYGAWTGDVLHEVRKLESGYRAVLTYKLYKQGHRESYIPAALRTSVEEQVLRIVSALSLLELPEGDRSKGGPVHFYLGFSLRHAYPPVGLKPRCLKGIDAIVHSIVSRLYETVLFTGYEVRSQQMCAMHVLKDQKFYSNVVFLTNDLPNVSFDGEDVQAEMSRKYPIVGNTVWLQLGYGALVGGGFCYGNWDCGTDWWYRQAYLLVSDKRVV